MRRVRQRLRIGKLRESRTELIALAVIPYRPLVRYRLCKHQFKRDHRHVINLIKMYLDDGAVGKNQ